MLLAPDIVEVILDGWQPANIEQARIVQLLVERVDVGPDGVDIRLRTEGLTNLVTEFRVIKPESRRAA